MLTNYIDKKRIYYFLFFSHHIIPLGKFPESDYLGKREQNFGRLYHISAHTLSVHEQNEQVEEEHFDYFLLKVVRLVCGLLGDQLVDNVEKALSQLDHVTSLLFLRVGDERGDKVENVTRWSKCTHLVMSILIVWRA
ncbi:hypothetical protein BpHYR1_001764 [Brachionus plicatilis]|uniref:Uncharacterized protein n=1 Tax=Brachionus plicatilis TaxID=10195 RepID=A0A3M7RHB9_BRAPC|nr:hypothetical protein BpHYR1_001764 [Brachionus plicatilis]